MKYHKLISGLRYRGFKGLDEIDNKGGCHKDDKHFILYTDGLIIYSNCWDWNRDDAEVNMWTLDFEGRTPYKKEREFNFKDLDEILCD